MDLVDANGDDERLSRFLDAEHDARQVDMRVVARDVSEHEAEGQHLAADEPMGGLEADAIFTDIHRGPVPCADFTGSRTEYRGVRRRSTLTGAGVATRSERGHRIV